MSNQIVISSGAKLRGLNGVITGTTGILDSVPLGGANGVATLDSSGKVPVSQLPSSVVTYLGTWNAATNTPTLANGTGDAGDMYLCNVAGTVNFGAGPISFSVGDWVLYGSGTWQKSNGQNGTVTSVAVTESGDALSITGSPVTTAGTINIGFAGTSAQYVAGNGSLITFPSLTGYVPYTGATADVNLGAYDLYTSKVWLYDNPNSAYGSMELTDGVLHFEDADGHSMVTMEDGYLTIANSSSIRALLNVSALSANRDFAFPNASGTLALTSDLSSYVPYTGATADVDLGTYNLKANSFNIPSAGSTNQLTSFANTSNLFSGSAGLNVFGFNVSNNIYFGKGATNGGVILWNNSQVRYYTLPDADGTVALTSNLSSYLPLSGGTLTGALNGTSIALTGTAGDSLLINHSVTRGIRVASSGSGYGILINNATGSTSIPFSIQQNGSSTITLNANGSAEFGGALTGTSATFSSSVTANGTVAIKGSNALYLYNTDNTTISAILNGGASGVGDMSFYTGGSQKMILNSTGYLGIGTSAPKTYLDVYNNSDIWHTFIGGATSKLMIGGQAGGGGVVLQGAAASTANNAAPTTFYNMYLQRDGGNVGIGTSSPGQKLSIAGRLNFDTYSTDVDDFGMWATSSGTTLASYSTSNIMFRTANTERMRITSSGSVGIATSSPNALLQVNGSSIIGSGTISNGTTFGGGGQVNRLKIESGNYTCLEINGSTSGGSIQFTYGSNAPNQVGGLIGYNYASGAANEFAIFNALNGALVLGTNNTERMRIRADGPILMNQTVSYGAETLEITPKISGGAQYGIIINGNPSSYSQYAIRFHNVGVAIVGSITFNTTSTSFNTSSDYRLKQDLKDYNGLDIVNSIKTYDYEWKSNNTRAYGVLAHELQEVIPYAVTGEKDGENIQGVDYSKIVPVLVKAIQELKAEIDELKNK